MARVAVFPGSFDPLTTAHAAIAELVVSVLDVTRVDLAISQDPLAKDATSQAPVDRRMDTIARACIDRPWLAVTTTTDRLIADIAAGYDVVVMGADKWHQLHDDRFYASAAARDAALAALPHVALVPRADLALPPPAPGRTILELPEALRGVSSSAVRAGAAHWRA